VGYTNPRNLALWTSADTLEILNTYDAEGNLTFARRSAEQNGYLTSDMTTTYAYDRANRPAAVTNSGKDSTVYDPAGNVVRTITARGHTLIMTYDALDRLIRRQVPQVDYAQAGCLEQGLGSGCGYRFPLYANLNGTDLRIAARTDTFAYDNGGNMIRAWNTFSHVSRTYNLDGTVASDTLRLRKYGDSTDTQFITHVYGMTFGYDLDGRRTRLTHPTNIDPGSAVDQIYTYDATGALLSVRDVKNNYFRFSYDAQGRPDSLAYPGGWERYEYDGDGRLIERTDNAGGSELQHDYLGYDQRGMIATVAGISWTATNVYSGLGKLVMYDAQKNWNGERVAEEYRPDGLSGLTWRRNLGSSQDPEHHYINDIVQSRLRAIVGFWPTGAGAAGLFSGYHLQRLRLGGQRPLLALAAVLLESSGPLLAGGAGPPGERQLLCGRWEARRPAAVPGLDQLLRRRGEAAGRV
jgi:YD repeat-containing protein